MPGKFFMWKLENMNFLKSFTRTIEALCLAYVRFVWEEKLCLELQVAKCLESDTKGEKLFAELKRLFDVKALHVANIISISNDSAPVMVGRSRCFLSYKL